MQIIVDRETLDHIENLLTFVTDDARDLYQEQAEAGNPGLAQHVWHDVQKLWLLINPDGFIPGGAPGASDDLHAH